MCGTELVNTVPALEDLITLCGDKHYRNEMNVGKKMKDQCQETRVSLPKGVSIAMGAAWGGSCPPGLHNLGSVLPWEKPLGNLLVRTQSIHKWGCHQSSFLVGASLS